MQECNIVDNGEYAFYVSACNDPTTVIDATNNWWGITDSASIEAMVYHHADNPTCPVVDYVPFADSSFGCCAWTRGNVDGDLNDQVNVADLTYLVDYLFRGGLAPPCAEEGNVDGNPAEQVNVADLTYLVDYLFRGGTPPPLCP